MAGARMTTSHVLFLMKISWRGFDLWFASAGGGGLVDVRSESERRKQREEALQASEAGYRRLFETAREYPWNNRGEANGRGFAAGP